jgi:DNA repair protein RecO
LRIKSKNANCIILGHKNYGEYHKLVFLYTEEFGKIKVVAKGARKISSKFTGHLETLNICQAALYFGPRNIILTEIQTIKSPQEIRDNLQKLSHALQIAEITNRMVYENQIYQELTPLLRETIEKLNHSEKPQLISQSYIIKLLDLVGLIPDFKETESNLDHKYIKFFQYLKAEPFHQIEKIKLSTEEKSIIEQITSRVIERETQKPLIQIG